LLRLQPVVSLQLATCCRGLRLSAVHPLLKLALFRSACRGRFRDGDIPQVRVVIRVPALKITLDPVLSVSKPAQLLQRFPVGPRSGYNMTADANSGDRPKSV
jgi:hypothetical protein